MFSYSVLISKPCLIIWAVKSISKVKMINFQQSDVAHEGAKCENQSGGEGCNVVYVLLPPSLVGWFTGDS